MRRRQQRHVGFHVFVVFVIWCDLVRFREVCAWSGCNPFLHDGLVLSCPHRVLLHPGTPAHPGTPRHTQENESFGRHGAPLPFKAPARRGVPCLIQPGVNRHHRLRKGAAIVSSLRRHMLFFGPPALAVCTVCRRRAAAPTRRCPGAQRCPVAWLLLRPCVRPFYMLARLAH